MFDGRITINWVQAILLILLLIFLIRWSYNRFFFDRQQKENMPQASVKAEVSKGHREKLPSAAEKREEVKRREEKMGPLRGRPDVRGVRLGMRIEEVWEVLQGGVDEWEGPHETPGEDRPYSRPIIKIRFQDGSMMKAEFCSRISGSQLFLISYEQYYREGVRCKEVLDKLEKKYGKPDNLQKLSSGGWWAAYGLVSAITPPDTSFGPGGAFFKTGVTPIYKKTRFAEKLDIVFNDGTLGDHDEAAINEDRKNSARRKFEENRSDQVTF